MTKPDAYPQNQFPEVNSHSLNSAIFVKELSERDHRRILKHFLALKNEDRLLRFGTVLSDELIEKYVQGLDSSHDKVFGVLSKNFRLVGVGHLAFAKSDGTHDSSQDTLTDNHTGMGNWAEFGVSVSSSARGKGIGYKLFERCAIHCRNAGVDTLTMHCLSSNKTMLHLAKKAGMEMVREYGETDAYLKVLPADAVSVLKEAVQEQVAALDYSIKANTRAALKWLGKIPVKKKPQSE